MDGVAHLTSAVAAHLREWEQSPPFVELAIFETSDPQRIAQILNAFCEDVLGARVVRGLFHQSSIGSGPLRVACDGWRPKHFVPKPSIWATSLRKMTGERIHAAIEAVYDAQPKN